MSSVKLIGRISLPETERKRYKRDIVFCDHCEKEIKPSFGDPREVILHYDKDGVKTRLKVCGDCAIELLTD